MNAPPESESLERIATALERIADALERSAKPRGRLCCGMRLPSNDRHMYRSCVLEQGHAGACKHGAE